LLIKYHHQKAPPVSYLRKQRDALSTFSKGARHRDIVRTKAYGEFSVFAK
jgi:hypothetical protein